MESLTALHVAAAVLQPLLRPVHVVLRHFPTIFWRARMYAPTSTSSRQFIPCVR